jgi:hypothetical protein
MEMMRYLGDIGEVEDRRSDFGRGINGRREVSCSSIG